MGQRLFGGKLVLQLISQNYKFDYGAPHVLFSIKLYKLRSGAQKMCSVAA